MRGRAGASWALLLAAGCGALGGARDGFPDAPLTPQEIERALDLSPLPDPPDDPTNAVFQSDAAARLGRAVFFDPGFSRSGTTSCATCHVPELGWSDGRPLPATTGAPEGREPIERHTISLFDVAHQRWFFWDGRADSLWSQALKPLESPRELGSSRLAVLHRIRDDAGLRTMYERVFGPLPALEDRLRFPPEGRPVPGSPDHPHARAWNEMNPSDRAAADRAFANVGKAIAAFERGIVSGPSPFDRFVEGLRENDPEKLSALSDPALRGLRLFLGKGRCHLCHDGPAFSDLEFHDNLVAWRPGESRRDPGRWLGASRVRRDPFNGKGVHSDMPSGEAALKIDLLAAEEHDRGAFKTPTLRNVALTPPYMHRGQLATLEDVVRHYADPPVPPPTHHQRERILAPLGLDEREIADLVAFLESLSGDPRPGRDHGRPPAEDGPR